MLSKATAVQSDSYSAEQVVHMNSLSDISELVQSRSSDHIFSQYLLFINNTFVVRTHMCACADGERYSKVWVLLKLLDFVCETTTCMTRDKCNWFRLKQRDTTAYQIKLNYTQIIVSRKYDRRRRASSKQTICGRHIVSYASVCVRVCQCVSADVCMYVYMPVACDSIV